MATTTLQVNSGEDDAYENFAGGVFSASQVVIAMDSATTNAARLVGGFRFADVQIPRGAVINSATLRVVPSSASFDDPKVSIACEDVDNASDFSADPDVLTRVGSRATSATVAWTATSLGAGSYVDSPDIRACVQEVINRANWTPGNALAVLVAGTNASPGGFRVHSYDSDPALAARLEINWTKTAKILVRTRRVDAGPVNVDSIGVAVYAAEIALIGPTFPTIPGPGAGAKPTS